MDAQCLEAMIVFKLIDHNIGTEHLLADLDTSVRPLEGDVFGVKGVHRDQDALETRLLETCELLPRHVVIFTPEAVGLHKGRRDSEFLSYFRRFEQQRVIQERLTAGEMQPVVQAHSLRSPGAGLYPTGKQRQ